MPVEPTVSQLALLTTAASVLAACATQPDEQVLLLTDDDTAPELIAAFSAALAQRGVADPAIITVQVRRPAFADLPRVAEDALLAADLVLDLTTSPWLYSDSLTRYSQECADAGSRLAMIWGMADSLPTIAACPPSPTLTALALRGLAALEQARTLHAWGVDGTDFRVELGEPRNYPRGFIGAPPTRPGMIGVPLCASVTAPFVPGTATGTLVFQSAGRFQGPVNQPFRSTEPIMIRVKAGKVVGIEGEHAAAITLADWFASGPQEDAYTLMDCNIGFDPRAELTWADNTVVHAYAGGIMIGMANPYTYRPNGSHRPGYHLDLMFPGLTVDLDDQPFLRAGGFVAARYAGED